jgi:hypothetical protein
LRWHGHDLQLSVTVLDAIGRPYVADVNEDDLWNFPTGQPAFVAGFSARTIANL